MTKFYIKSNENRFLIDSKNHLEACKKALNRWEEQQKNIGKVICFSNYGFDSVVSNNCIDTDIIKGLTTKKRKKP